MCCRAQKSPEKMSAELLNLSGNPTRRHPDLLCSFEIAESDLRHGDTTAEVRPLSCCVHGLDSTELPSTSIRLLP